MEIVGIFVNCGVGLETQNLDYPFGELHQRQLRLLSNKIRSQ